MQYLVCSRHGLILFGLHAYVLCVSFLVCEERFTFTCPLFEVIKASIYVFMNVFPIAIFSCTSFTIDRCTISCRHTGRWEVFVSLCGSWGLLTIWETINR